MGGTGSLSLQLSATAPGKHKEQGTSLEFATDVGADEWQKPSY